MRYPIYNNTIELMIIQFLKTPYLNILALFSSYLRESLPKGSPSEISRISKNKILKGKNDEFCEGSNIAILNGRIRGDNKGEFTFIPRQGCFVIDYCCFF